MTLTASERVLRARLGALALHARRDPRETTTAARAVLARRFETAVDPDGKLDPAERKRRADAARKAYMAKLALRSSIARRKKRTSRPREAARARSSEVRRGAAPTG